MKKSSAYVSGLILASSTMLFSCTKTDISADVPEVTTKKKVDCEITAFRFNTLFDNGTVSKYVFKKEIDAATGKLKQVTAAIYQGGAISSSITLDVLWSAGSIAFVNAASHTDTVLIATLNAQGRPVNVVNGNKANADYLPTSFEYVSNRLSAMRITLGSSVLVSTFAYNSDNNCTLIQDESRAGEVPGRIEYSYDNRKADKQVYFDEPRPFSWNTFSLMQFSGLLNELNPVNLRTGVKVWWANNYKVYDVELANHQLNNKTLVKYDVVYPGTTMSTPYFLEMQCDNAAGKN